jgi:hypothetical protein
MAIILPDGRVITSEQMHQGRLRRRALTPDDLHQSKADRRWQDAVEHLLEAKYPGWSWHVVIRSDQGIVSVKCLEISRNYGVVIKLGNTDTPAEWRRAILHAGGELLERSNQRRGRRPEAGRITKVDGIPERTR